MDAKTIDGAIVLSQATGMFGIGGVDNNPIVMLAIAFYEGESNAFYLFACNSQNEVVGDLLYSSIADAKRDAERFYEVSPIHWIDL